MKMSETQTEILIGIAHELTDLAMMRRGIPAGSLPGMELANAIVAAVDSRMDGISRPQGISDRNFEHLLIGKTVALARTACAMMVFDGDDISVDDEQFKIQADYIMQF
jgi:hypothetical protein